MGRHRRTVAVALAILVALGGIIAIGQLGKRRGSRFVGAIVDLAPSDDRSECRRLANALGAGDSACRDPRALFTASVRVRNVGDADGEARCRVELLGPNGIVRFRRDVPSLRLPPDRSAVVPILIPGPDLLPDVERRPVRC